MKALMKNTISIKEFYSQLPNLHTNFQNKIDKLKKSYCHDDFNTGRTKYIVIFAQKYCIDSVVNLNVLKCIEKETNLGIFINTDEMVFNDYYSNRRTPLIFGLDEDYNKLWEWERVPKIISQVEKSDNQVDIIVMKRDYRYGKYLENTLNEILDLMGSTNE